MSRKQTILLRFFIAPVVVLILSLTMGAPLLASADVNDFTIDSFTSKALLSKADPQGQLTIEEDIKLTFTDFNHGILRAIPDRYKNHKLQLHVLAISSPSGAPTSYTTYTSNGNTVLKIGDASRTITGKQEYVIRYTLNNVISFYNDHDELYWDVNGDQWSQQFLSVQATLTLPNGTLMTQAPRCFTGSYGSTEQNCTVTRLGPQTISFATTSPLGANQTLSYVVAMPKGTFARPTLIDTLGEYAATAMQFFIPLVLTAGIAGLAWFIKGRDSKGTSVIVPQYDAPDDMKALQVGAIYDFDVQNADITATIIDLAIRGYITITETKVAKKLRADAMEYSIEIRSNDYANLSNHEQQLMRALFDDAPIGTTVTLKSLATKLYKTSQSIAKNIDGELTDAGYFRTNPKKTGAIISGIALFGLVILFFSFGVLGLPAAVGLALGVALAFAFAHAMPARTAKGVMALEHIKGLKLYLTVAEKDRIQKLQSPNAPYAAASNEPTKTVELFEKLLPYAIVLGVEKEWGAQFKSLYKSPPEWYNGNTTAFSALYVATNINQGFNTAVSTAFSAPKSSSSSGFGGGGFSGGGGGGGGGGGW